MKITEAQIRDIIRQQLIKEFRVARVKRFNWTTCKNVDLPDHLIKTKAGRDTVRRVEKAAATAAQVYGVPGMFCDIFSSLMGDNPNRKYNRDEEKDDRDRSVEDFAIYAAAVSDYADKKSIYVTEILDHKDDAGSDADTKKERAAAADLAAYKQIKSSIVTQTRTITSETEPLDFLNEMNGIIGIGSKYGKSEVKKLISQAKKKKDPNGPRKICQAIASDSAMFVDTIASQNLQRTEISDKYSSIPSYNLYLAEVSSSL